MFPEEEVAVIFVNTGILNMNPFWAELGKF